MADSSKMRYDLNKVPPNKTVVGHFPELAQYSEFSDKKQDLILRMAIWSTDENSPFVIEERDDYERLITNIGNYVQVKDKSVLESIIKGLNQTFNQMVNRYFILCDNLAYVMWKDKFMMFHYIGMALRAPIDMKNLERDMAKRTDLEAKREGIHQSLVYYESQVFPNTFTRKTIRKEVAKILQLAEKYAEDKTVI